MHTFLQTMMNKKAVLCFGFFLALTVLIQFLPSQAEAGGGGGGGGFDIVIGPIDIYLGDLVDVNGNIINPMDPPPAITSVGSGNAEWCWSGTCYTGTNQEALDFVTYYLGLIVGEFGTVTGSTILYDDAGRVIYIACVNGGVVNVTYADPTGTTDVCPDDAGIQTSLAECSCTPTNSCADTTCNTTTCYNGCAAVTGTMDCSISQDADHSALPATIDSGDSSMLNYSCNPAAPASILPTVGALNGGAPVTSNSVSVSPLANTTYTLTCFGSTNATADATVTINAACVPFVGQPCAPVNICGMSNTGAFDCAGACSVVAPADALCPVNTNPNTPSITGPVSSDTLVTNVFTLTATDPDGDSIYYQIDWDNDGWENETTPTVASGFPRNVNRSWPLDGVYTFSARTVDTAGGLSAWTSHTVTVANAPTANIEAQVNGTGAWSSGDQTVNPSDTIVIRWTSTDAPSGCSGTNVATGGVANSAGVAVITPAPNASLTYSVTCTGPGGSITEDIVVTSNGLPNLTTAVTFDTSAATVDPVTGYYNSTEVRIRISNVGQSVAGASAYRLEIDYGNAPVDFNQTTALAAIPTGGHIDIFRTFNNVPFGPIFITVTADPSNVVAEGANEGDNVATYNLTLPPQKPPSFAITTTPDVVREGQTATLNWDTGVTYPLNCSVSGPALTPSPYTFDPSLTARTGSRNTGALSAKSEYLLSCTEPVTNTTFTETASVDVIPTAEEI